MLKRAFDIVAAACALIVLTPVLVTVALIVRLSSPGPILYGARRVGRNGRTFTMYKFRTMRHEPERTGPRITAAADDRVVEAGRLLRRAKLDELPQLLNVLVGDMSVVGPRPEDPDIVDEHYTGWMRTTLVTRPGLTSPGALFGTTHGDGLLSGGDPEAAYVDRVLPIKLALERVYLERQSFGYDMRILGRTIGLVVRTGLGGGTFPDPPELPRAQALLEASTASSEV